MSNLDVLIAPDSCTHITRPSCERTARRTWRHADDGVLVTLQHELRVAGSGVPELDAAVLGTGEDPISVRCESDRENEVLRHILVSCFRCSESRWAYLVSFECLDASSTLGTSVGVSTSGCNKLPHLDSLVQTSGDEIFPVWCEGNGVDGVFVSVWALEALDKIAGCGIPDADALVERSGGNELSVWRDGNSGDTILDAQSEDVLASLNIPETDSAVTATRSDSAAITGKVERVDILLMASKCISDGARSDVPHSDQLVLGTSSKISSIRAETNASDVKIANSINRVILENADL